MKTEEFTIAMNDSTHGDYILSDFISFNHETGKCKIRDCKTGKYIEMDISAIRMIKP